MNAPLLRPALLLCAAFALACSGEDTTPTTTAPVASTTAAEAPSCAQTLATYSGRFSGEAALSPAQVLQIPADQRRFVRNEIFARYGRSFSSEDLQQHFGAQSWYCADPEFQDSRLSATDRKNVSLIKSFEGDNSAKLQAFGQLSHELDGFSLLLQTDDRLEIVDSAGGMYGWEPQSRYWSSQGEWVITWDGAAEYGSGATDAQAWRVNVKQGTLVEPEGVDL